MAVPRATISGLALVIFFMSPAHSITPLEQMEADRKQMEEAIAKQQCPDVLKYKTSPDFKATCPLSCTGLHDEPLDNCLKNYWACFASYKSMLKTAGNYTKFLDSTCTQAAKNAKAENEAAEARVRAKEMDESNAKRDKK
jgi:hypothetical protein